MVERILTTNILQQLQNSRKVIVLYGARQIGKTTLIKTLQKEYSGKCLLLNGDLKNVQDTLSSQDLETFKNTVDDNDLLIIDEAQNIPNIGINLKILFDEFPNLKIIATGSSSFELANTLKEPLTGRKTTLKMYPISLMELRKTNSIFELKAQLGSFLTYGMYPEILTLQGSNTKQQHLQELVSSYLYKDILALSNIKHSDKIHKLLQLLAHQVGSLVSVNELSNKLGLNHETINNYINLLEDGFIIQRLSGLSNNPRNEISKMDKIYFTDIGIRNAIIENYSPIDIRNDIGAIWENFIFMERQKYVSYNNIHGKNYFWRRYSGSEIDLIEMRDGMFHAFEIKWNKRKTSAPKSWLLDYPNSTFTEINQDNFTDYVL